MKQTPEEKVAESLVNLIETEWFNPIAIARYLANQPHKTTDKTMQMIVWLVRKLSERYESEYNSGRTSEGLFIARELYLTIEELSNEHTFTNVPLPKTAEQLGRDLKVEDIKPSKYSYIRETNTPSIMDVQRVSLF